MKKLYIALDEDTQRGLAYHSGCALLEGELMFGTKEVIEECLKFEKVSFPLMELEEYKTKYPKGFMGITLKEIFSLDDWRKRTKQ